MASTMAIQAAILTTPIQDEALIQIIPGPRPGSAGR
jgi:hypothetical protein